MNILDYDPAATRRPDVPGEPVQMADGRAWHLAAPQLRLHPIWREDGPPRTGYRVGYPLGTERRVDSLREVLAAEPPDPEAQHAALVALGIDLILAAHDVPAAAAVELLRLDLAGLRRLAGDVVRIITLGSSGQGGDRP